jgi:hypothetical protein
MLRAAASSVLLLAALGCEHRPATQASWRSTPDSTGTIQLVDAQAVCSDCVSVESVVVLGDSDGPGYIEVTEWVTIDSLHRYWVGQRDLIKVFDSGGSFLREVGRAGHGPMEFQYALPLHTDSLGKVHVLDARNNRETVIEPDFRMAADTPLHPVGIINHAAPLPGHAYVVNAWITSAERLGSPLHVLQGREITRSFGASEATGPLDAFKSLRLIASSPSDGTVFTSKRFTYEIEVWSSDGRRIAGFVGPTLNTHEVRQTFYNRTDNPVPNEIRALQVESATRRWVISRRVRPNWQAHYVDRTYPNGQVGLRRREDSPLDSVYVSRVELLDLDQNAVIARLQHPALFVAFAGQHRLLENRFSSDGTPQVVVWHLTLTSTDSR